MLSCTGTTSNLLAASVFGGSSGSPASRSRSSLLTLVCTFLTLGTPGIVLTVIQASSTSPRTLTSLPLTGPTSPMPESVPVRNMPRTLVLALSLPTFSSLSASTSRPTRRVGNLPLRSLFRMVPMVSPPPKPMSMEPSGLARLE